MAELEPPKPHEMEEHAVLRANPFTRRVALTTSIFAVVLALAALGSTNTMKKMLLAQQQASDQWAFYQAKVIREHQYRAQKMRLEMDLLDDRVVRQPALRDKMDALRSKFAEEEQRYQQEKKQIEEEAKKLEGERDKWRTRDPNFEFGEALLQIAIVLSSVSILASSPPVYYFSLTVACFGGLLTLNGYLNVLTLPLGH